MKRFLAIAMSIALILPTPAYALRLNTPLFKINTAKVVSIVGMIDDDMLKSVRLQLRAGESLPEAQVVLIDSPGDMVDSGVKIIDALEATHRPLVCVVTGMAASMAFNLLSHCQTRLAFPNSHLLFHHIAIMGDPGIRLTAENMRDLADRVSVEDRIFDSYNAPLLHMSISEYQKGLERWWKAAELVSNGYLQGYASFD